jgi:ubiquinone/menaquinone biosynthesis C-methylase UbiE
MKPQSQDKIIKCYNTTAAGYATDRIDELSKKHLDRLLLKEFARANKHKGLCVDFGCGPGHATKFLHDHGLKNIIGVDLSSEMIENAQRLFPEIRFETGDLLDLSFELDYFGSATAFYAIVHFNYDQIGKAFSEIYRVLKKGGQFLFSYHVGDEIVHFDKAHDKNIDIDLYYFQTDKILELIDAAGFRIIDTIERRPYEAVEYATRRAYIWTEKN